MPAAVPMGHSAHVVASFLESVDLPTGHTEHVLISAASLYKPYPHGRQDADACVLVYRPAEHELQEDSPVSSWLFPIGQTVQDPVALVVFMNLPLPHISHVTVPTLGAIRPTGHSSQVVAPTLPW